MTDESVSDEASDDSSFVDLYEEAPCGYLSTTAEGVVIRANETFLRLTGRTRERVVGRPLADLLDSGGRLFYETRLLPILRLNGEAREVSLAILRADGSASPVLVNAVVVRGDDSDIRFLRFAVFDASARQDYERQLLAARRAAEESEARVRVLQDAAASFSGLDSEAQVDAAIVSIFGAAFDASDVVILSVDRRGSLQLKSGPTPLDRYLGDTPERPIANAALLGEIVTVSSPADAETRFPGSAAAMRTARYGALTAVPMIHDGSVLGVISCLFRREREFDEAAVELQSALARQAAQVLVRLRLQQQLEALALSDQLTGLGNRVMIEGAIQQALHGAAEIRRPVALIFIDLDGFKVINDELGHGVGDDVLKEVTRRMSEAVRHEDRVGRLGGDEFLIVCEDTDGDDARAIAERVCNAIRQPLDDAQTYPITASVGIAVKAADRESSVTVATMIELADQAMYASKQAGKDRITVVEA
ncbi:diguanylate cyclase [Diaminobutyricibacter tongyongensis]|uniref:Diguanylate cyclase n=1 Tax=Leifsonia tongyongensis TaxID=1268043 RepID=A0A6L9XWK2_9MICO|nr:diguanylate cyclase [Diaminobutyricibacter tongyongensis]NEN05398.1 diguanylate cyclase [Diaminobutyricibacter tongyongensis]